MKFDLKAISLNIVAVARRNAIELAECLWFYLVYEIMHGVIVEEKLSAFPIIFFLTLFARRLSERFNSRWIYYLTPILTVVAMVVDMSEWIGSGSYIVSLIVSMLLLLIANGGKSNDSSGRALVSTLVDAVQAGAIALVSLLALCAISATVAYVFDVWSEWDRHVPLIVFVIILPMAFCGLGAGESRDEAVATIVERAMRWIVCPATIIYTAILYLYLVKIVATWTLPLGGLAAMLSAFYAVAFACKMILSVSTVRWYDWFFNRFHIISLPLLVLFWTGLVYRLWEYSLTESRCYLVVAGALMTAFSLMMFWRRSNNWRAMQVIVVVALMFTAYTPGVNAYQLTLRAQSGRLIGLARQIGACDSEGHLLVNVLKSTTDTKARNEISKTLNYIRQTADTAYVVERFGVASLDDEVREMPYRYMNRDDSPIDCRNAEAILFDTKTTLSISGQVKVARDSVSLLDERLDVDALRKAYLNGDKVVADELMRVENDSIVVYFRRVQFDCERFLENDFSVDVVMRKSK